MIYKIRIKGDFNKELIENVKQEHKEKVEGIYELYDSLFVLSYAESYCKDRIYYVAYTLAKNNIDFIIKEV